MQIYVNNPEQSDVRRFAGEGLSTGSVGISVSCSICETVFTVKTDVDPRVHVALRDRADPALGSQFELVI